MSNSRLTAEGFRARDVAFATLQEAVVFVQEEIRAGRGPVTLVLTAANPYRFSGSAPTIRMEAICKRGGRDGVSISGPKGYGEETVSSLSYVHEIERVVGRHLSLLHWGCYSSQSMLFLQYPASGIEKGLPIFPRRSFDPLVVVSEIEDMADFLYEWQAKTLDTEDDRIVYLFTGQEKVWVEAGRGFWSGRTLRFAAAFHSVRLNQPVPRSILAAIREVREESKRSYDNLDSRD